MAIQQPTPPTQQTPSVTPPIATANEAAEHQRRQSDALESIAESLATIAGHLEDLKAIAPAPKS